LLQLSNHPRDVRHSELLTNDVDR